MCLFIEKKKKKLRNVVDHRKLLILVSKLFEFVMSRYNP